MSSGVRHGQLKPIRDLGTRSIQTLNGNDTRGVSQPTQLRNTDFPTDVGEEVRVLYDPNENEVTLKPANEE
jgi:hypothetical protein